MISQVKSNQINKSSSSRKILCDAFMLAFCLIGFPLVVIALLGL